ncbi:N-formylglutamate amidohydrolase [Ruegeria conchae]|uniref:Putative N-formylglutamate amidohydrolase n=1 Tax=Ruegeria conchae TaxID=981384 RepID=A0A497YUB2_9RHOB|nr:N-formylglutamate amidohydrolase [Ruegeria conchae]RLJ98517.1 putative N-formylglutamate amidohydrolase [Ruegeria conchae]
MIDPVEILNPNGKGRVVLLCEHASSTIPEAYDELGLADKDRLSHAVWDPGAREVTLALSAALDAPAILLRVSRLVYDCNRPPDAPSAIPERSELIEVPGNQNLNQSQRDARIQSVYGPFCAAVSGVLEARNNDPVVVTIHSFTPIYYGAKRAVEIGLLHDEDSRLADAMLARKTLLSHRRVERNEPYGPGDGVTHSLRLHAQSRGLANVMIEVRNDLMRSPEDVAEITEELLTLLQPAIKEIAHLEELSWAER